MRKRFPTALELVYDNYQFLAIGYCASERASDCIASLAVSPKGVALSFYYGATLAGPKRLILAPGARHNESLNGNVWVEIERWIDRAIGSWQA